MTEKEEFCENIRNCEGSMYFLARSIVRNDADAAEVISESVYRAYKSLSSLKSRESFKAWILRIVHNTAVEMVRKNAKIIPMEEISPSAAAEDTAPTADSRLSVRKAVESLRQPYRTVVTLFYYDNLSVSEIAKITGSSLASVKKQLSRAREMLRESLKEDFAHE
ncbi:MAG: sigma-70 family RNA polymerase sigma factor [Oscillospiraceae bacterium]|nr:sigma-70 family RNA polymerase sigma factor [Oscillospiraceae bacterium]